MPATATATATVTETHRSTEQTGPSYHPVRRAGPLFPPVTRSSHAIFVIASGHIPPA